jgi:hypothetical protein
MTEDERLVKDIQREYIKASAGNLKFMKPKIVQSRTEEYPEEITMETGMQEGQRVLDAASKIVANENPALFGDQVTYNTRVAELVELMKAHRSKALGDATFTVLVHFAYEFEKILNGTVHNSDSYLQACASLGSAAECAAKEDKA